MYVSDEFSDDWWKSNGKYNECVCFTENNNPKSLPKLNKCSVNAHASRIIAKSKNVNV